MTGFAEIPDYGDNENFCPDDQGETFDAEEIHEIAENAVWPLVDSLWRGNWRTDSIPGPSFIYPKAGMYKGRMLEATLKAECERVPPAEIVADETDTEEAFGLGVAAGLEEPSDSANVLTLAVDVNIEEPAPELLEDLLAVARERDPVGFVNFLIRQRLTEDDMRQGMVLAKKVTTYSFTTEDDCDRDQYLSLFDCEGYQFWRSDLGFDLEPDEDDETSETGNDPLWELSKADIRNLLAAANVLGAQEGVLIYLEALASPEIEAQQPTDQTLDLWETG